MRKKVLLIAATTGYQVREFADAARAVGVELVLATDRCHVLENPWGDAAVPIRFEDPAGEIESLAAHGPFDGIVAAGDKPALVAAHIAARYGLRFSPPDAVFASKNKFLARERFREAGLLVPHYRLVPLESDPHEAAGLAHCTWTRYPCVLKPLELSASRGVIRANDATEFVDAFLRIRKIVPRDDSLQVEDFIPGREFALEGLLSEGRLQTLALFDKPDPLDGPFFEETIYLTPSREPAEVQASIRDAAQRAVTALGLTHGPVHAEMRVNSGTGPARPSLISETFGHSDATGSVVPLKVPGKAGVWMLEVAARPIGGLCSRVLRFESGESLEQIILRHALGEDVSRARLAPGAHGVMMIPIPQAGVYAGVSGLERARAVPGVEDIVITAKPGQMMLPLPEGASYLGFIFARGASAGLVRTVLKESYSRLEFQLCWTLPVVK
jgi:biotin carboxylase